jgi:hypothetical protein
MATDGRDYFATDYFAVDYWAPLYWFEFPVDKNPSVGVFHLARLRGLIYRIRKA